MANRYWVGGTGNINDTAHWSDVDGGTGGFSVPTSTVDVYFTSNSFTAASQIVTINVALNCLSMNWTGVTNTPTLYTNSNLTMSVYGNLTLVSGMILSGTYAGKFAFPGTATGLNIYTAGLSLRQMSFSGSGGWILQDSCVITGSEGFIHTRGTLDTNGQSITTTVFTCNGSSTRVLTLGASQIVTTGNVTFTTTGLTLNEDTSQFYFKGTIFAGGGSTFNDVVLDPTLSIVTIVGSNTYNDLNFFVPMTVKITAGTTQTFTTLTGDGGANNPMQIISNIPGTQYTLSTSGTISRSYCLIEDANAAGTGTITLDNSDDKGNNTNITFTNSIDLHTRYWIGDTGSWSNIAHWSCTSGGAGGAPIPFDITDVRFDVNSFTTTGRVVTLDVNGICNSIDWTGSLYNPAFNGTNTIWIHSNLTYITNMTASARPLSMGSPDRASDCTIISAGKGFSSTSLYDGSVFRLGDALDMSDYFSLNNGTFYTNNYNISCQDFVLSDHATSGPTLYLGSSIINIGTSFPNEAVNINNANGNITLDAGTSKFILRTATKAFKGGGLTFYDLEFAGGLSASKTITITGSNTFHNISITNAGAGLILQAGTTQTINNLLGNGNGGALITLTSSTAGSAATISTANAINRSFYDVRDITGAGSGSITFDVSYNRSNNTNITFTNLLDIFKRYWVDNGGDWDHTHHWSYVSGGVGGAPVPSTSDDVRFDANSFSSTGQTITKSGAGNPRVFSIDFTGVTNSPTIASMYFQIYGDSAIFSPNMTVGIDSRIYFTSVLVTNTDVILDCGGHYFDYISASSGDYLNPNTLSLASAINVRAFQVFNSNKFRSNNYAMTTDIYSGLIDFQGALSADLGSSEIHTHTFQATSYSSLHSEIAVTHTGNLYVLKKIGVYSSDGSPVQLGNLFLGIDDYYGYEFQIGSSGVIRCTDLTLYRENSYRFYYQLVGIDPALEFVNLYQNAESGKEITILSNNSAYDADFICISGIVSVDWWKIYNSGASGGATFYAGANSIDGGGNTGWIFSTPPTGLPIYFGEIQIVSIHKGTTDITHTYKGTTTIF